MLNILLMTGQWSYHPWIDLMILSNMSNWHQSYYKIYWRHVIINFFKKKLSSSSFAWNESIKLLILNNGTGVSDYINNWSKVYIPDPNSSYVREKMEWLFWALLIYDIIFDFVYDNEPCNTIDSTSFSHENENTRRTLMLNAKIYCNHTILFEFPIANRIFFANYYLLSIFENDVKFEIVCK